MYRYFSCLSPRDSRVIVNYHVWDWRWRTALIPNSVDMQIFRDHILLTDVSKLGKSWWATRLAVGYRESLYDTTRVDHELSRATNCYSVTHESTSLGLHAAVIDYDCYTKAHESSISTVTATYTSATLHGASATRLPPWWLIYHLGDSSTTLVARSSADKRRSKNFMYFSAETTRFSSESECYAAVGWATLHIVLLTDNALYNYYYKSKFCFHNMSLTILAGCRIVYFTFFTFFILYDR